MAVTWLRAHGSFAALLAVIVASVPATCCGANLTVVIRDSEGNPLQARVLIRPKDSNCITPKDAAKFSNGPDTWFAVNGRATLDVPEGPIEIRVERGVEYVRVREQVDVPAKGLTHKVTLRRWIDLKKLGYLCGENHIHIENLDDLGRLLAAEGMDFGSMLQWWDGPRADIPSGPAVRSLGWEDAKVPTSVYDAELEHDWGAVYIIDVPKKLEWADDNSCPNLSFIKAAHVAGAIINYNGGWDRECLLDAVLAYVHIVSICNNQFQMNRFQPRAGYSNLLGVPGFPTYPETSEGMLQLNTDTYYRLLNCGLRLAAGAGTACGVKQSPPGWNRVYAECKSGASYKEFCGAWAAGKNFVTNGPAIFLTTTDGKKPGDDINLAAGGGKIRCCVTVQSEPKVLLTKAEIIVNGEVAAAFEPDAGNRICGEIEITIAEGSWIAARCAARDTMLTDKELEAYADTKSGLILLPSNLRFAHTSPIYVTVQGKNAAVKKSLNEALLALDHFEIFARKTAGKGEIDPLISEVAKARSVLLNKLE